MLIDGDETTEKELRINLNEVYERLEEIDARSAPARAGAILFGLGFDSEMQARRHASRGHSSNRALAAPPQPLCATGRGGRPRTWPARRSWARS